jgi:amidophosphoribosyltransferase
MCGIFGIANHADASSMTHLGLYALQHRGQESTGISSSDGDQVHTHKSMGYVADIFSEEVLRRLKGTNAIGHTRYSTAGDSSEGNAQPIVVKNIRTFGTVALVHNGNLINAMTLRDGLEQQGAIFQSTSDSEVILHLLARSVADNIVDALAETLAQVQGAFSLLLLTQDSLIAVRDPNGFRPLNMGTVNGSHVFASETCAFDLLGATYVREVEPGEIVAIRGSEFRSMTAVHAPRLAKVRLRTRLLSRPTASSFGRTVQTSRDLMGRFLAQESPVDADLVVPIPDSASLPPSGTRRNPASVRIRSDSESLCRPDFHRTQNEDSPLRREGEAEPRKRTAQRKARCPHR